MSDDMTLVPEYELDWGDHSRSTAEIEEAEQFPEAIEVLAHVARGKDDCEVTLVSMGA